eukprot:TRINITY_DN1546_c0_g1_i1.p1 TRINITY_DN1546_c0_g1~~TRINITY_DN1546_c0_g1_i1.p1  ORF type:complete len:1046 (-),score=535.76 TRINITY_DN1546_c0_g1_i1:94-3231(-)
MKMKILTLITLISFIFINLCFGNDECNQALTVPIGISATFNLNSATASLNPTCGVQTDIWFNFTSTCSGLTTVSLCGSSFDSILSVFPSSACMIDNSTGLGFIQPNQMLACDDDGCSTGTFQSQLTFISISDSNYLIRVGRGRSSSSPLLNTNGVLRVFCADSTAKLENSYISIPRINSGGSITKFTLLEPFYSRRNIITQFNFLLQTRTEETPFSIHTTATAPAIRNQQGEIISTGSFESEPGNIITWTSTSTLHKGTYTTQFTFNSELPFARQTYIIAFLDAAPGRDTKSDTAVLIRNEDTGEFSHLIWQQMGIQIFGNTTEGSQVGGWLLRRANQPLPNNPYWDPEGISTFTAVENPLFPRPLRAYEAGDVALALAYTLLPDATIAKISFTIQVELIARADLYKVDEDSSISISESEGILTNDLILVSGPISISIWVQPKGHLNLASNGSFTYSPLANFNGLDYFTYIIRDTHSALVSIANVTINVTAINDAPIAINSTFQLDEDSEFEISAPGLYRFVRDIENDNLTISIKQLPLHGTLEFHSQDATFKYIPFENFFGIDNFTFFAIDHHNATSNIATITFEIRPINDEPLIKTNDEQKFEFYTVEDHALTISAPGILAYAYDVDADNLTAILVKTTQNGNLQLFANGSFVYTPNSNYFGEDSFQFKVSDSHVTSSETETVKIIVASENDAPIANDDHYSIAEETILFVDVKPNGILTNDIDVDGTLGLIPHLQSNVSNGELQFYLNGSFIYIPHTNFNGQDHFTYYVIDEHGHKSTIATVTITVFNVNDAPKAFNDYYEINEDSKLIISDDDDYGILANDTDVDDQQLTAILVTRPHHGSIELNIDGTFTYTPESNFHGFDSFVYAAYDDDMAYSEATVTILVLAINDIPQARNDSYNVTEDIVLVVNRTLGVLANDTDIHDGDSLNAILLNNTLHGVVILNSNGSFEYYPQSNFYGEDIFIYRADDGKGGRSIAYVTINVIADNSDIVMWVLAILLLVIIIVGATIWCLKSRGVGPFRQPEPQAVTIPVDPSKRSSLLP